MRAPARARRSRAPALLLLTQLQGDRQAVDVILHAMKSCLKKSVGTSRAANGLDSVERRVDSVNAACESPSVACVAARCPSALMQTSSSPGATVDRLRRGGERVARPIHLRVRGREAAHTAGRVDVHTIGEHLLERARACANSPCSMSSEPRLARRKSCTRSEVDFSAIASARS